MRTHALARCCWCGGRFVWAVYGESGGWVCETAACRARQLARAIVTEAGGKKQLLWLPLPRQVEFLEAPQKYVLFGGAAGGAKSHALRWFAYLLCLKTPDFRVLLLRRTFKDLERTHMREAEREVRLFSGVFVPSAKLVRFPNGSVLEFGHCEDAGAASNYLSAEYDAILPDELVTFERDMSLLIWSRARTRKPGVTPLVRPATNPGGPQSAWVRSFFIDKNVDRGEFPHYDPDDYAFIPSKLEDNPYLNQDYEQGLLALPEALRRAYREGDWDIFPGQFFPEWRRARHVTPTPLAYPPEYPRVRAIDWGYVKPGWCGWFVLLPDGEAYLEEEYVFTRTIGADVAKVIDRRTKERRVRVRYTVADTAMWAPESDTGESLAETFARHGVPLIKADKDRVNGWQRVRHWLQDSPAGRPWLRVSPGCPYAIRTLPSLVSDAQKPEDVDSDGEDHAGDAWRYWAMSRPMPGAMAVAAKRPEGSFAWWKDRASAVTSGILGGRS